MQLSRLAPPRGAHKKNKRVGRGESSGHGKTCCRGGKGQKGRAGATIRAGFEGGQKPMYRRFPKLGFTSRKKVLGTNRFATVNLADLEAFKAGASVGPVELVGNNEARVKLLGQGTVAKALTVRVHAVSQSAKAAVEAAGGSVQLIES